MSTEWLDVKDAAQHARCGMRSIYLGVQQGKLRAARLGGRRELRFRREWVDDWLLASSTPEFVNPMDGNTDRNQVESAEH